jgi:hypothetical protein
MDPIFAAFLEAHWQEGSALAEQSDRLELVRLDPQHIVAEFSCRGMVLDGDGQPAIAERFRVGFAFSDQYLRMADPSRVVTWLGPREVFHPNIGIPYVCLGRIDPGTPLVDLATRCYELITYQNVTFIECDAFNSQACHWARNNQELLPVDTRPLKRRRVEPRIDQMGVA